MALSNTHTTKFRQQELPKMIEKANKNANTILNKMYHPDEYQNTPSPFAQYSDEDIRKAATDTINNELHAADHEPCVDLRNQKIRYPIQTWSDDHTMQEQPIGYSCRRKTKSSKEHVDLTNSPERELNSASSSQMAHSSKSLFPSW